MVSWTLHKAMKYLSILPKAPRFSDYSWKQLHMVLWTLHKAKKLIHFAKSYLLWSCSQYLWKHFHMVPLLCCANRQLFSSCRNFPHMSLVSFSLNVMNKVSLVFFRIDLDNFTTSWANPCLVWKFLWFSATLIIVPTCCASLFSTIAVEPCYAYTS